MALIGGCLGVGEATINVYLSTSAPTGLQATFLADVTNQYLGSVSSSPYFKDTYSMTLTGKNPAYQPPPQVYPIDTQKVIQEFIANSTWTYVYGWAAGQEYERNQDLGSISNFLVNCSSAPVFKGSTTTWSPSTCSQVLGIVSNYIYQQFFSSPTVILP